MLEILASNRFRKDLKLAHKRGCDINLIKVTIFRLANCEKLEPQYNDHDLIGKYIGFRECHLKPDWLLIYRVEKDKLILFLSRTGTHSDLYW